MKGVIFHGKRKQSFNLCNSMLSIVPATLGIRQTQKAQEFNLMADGYRAMSLAKTYDAKAAAEALKLTIKEVM